NAHSASGTSSRPGGGTGSATTRRMNGSSPSPDRYANGGRPARTAYSVAPSPYTSLAGPYSPRSRVSGAAHSTDSASAPRLAPPAGRTDRPKSASAGSPSARSNTLAGFRSRCTTPSACALASVPASVAPSSTTTATAGRTRSASVPPGQYSLTRYGRPSGRTPAASTTTTLRLTVAR